MKYKIPFIKPSFPDSKILSKDFRLIQESNWFSNFGPFEEKLSKASAAFVSPDAFVTTVANATLGIQIAVSLLFSKSPVKKEVIVPSFTFAAAPEILIAAGYTPVLIDIVPSSLQPDHKQAADYLTVNKERVAGILIGNSFGVGNTQINEWEMIAKDNNLPLIIDSAAGFGSKYSFNEKIGIRGDCEIFSLHATKPFAIGEGGLVISRNTKVISALRSLQNFGFEEDRLIHRIGTNAKLQEFSCAIGLRQLENFEERIEKRQNVLQKYKSRLIEQGFRFQDNDEFSTVPFASVMTNDYRFADEIYNTLHADGVEVRRYYTPLHKQEIISTKSIIPYSLAVTDDIASKILSLPVHDDMKEREVESIVRSILKVKAPV